MQTRKWLEEGFCPVDRYSCLMPVEYIAEEENGKGWFSGNDPTLQR